MATIADMMTRCECHGVPFARVLAYARRHDLWEFDSLIAAVGCGRTCTACHCDLKLYLDAARRSPSPTSEPSLCAASAPAGR